jgi:hypothetical protein
MENKLKGIREKFMQLLSYELNAFYNDIKLRQHKDPKLKNRIEGIMLVGTRMEIVEGSFLQQHIEAVHFEVFGMSINERRLKEIKDEPDTVDWNYYNSPTIHRQRSHEGEL